MDVSETIEWIGWPLAAGLLVLMTHVPLGVQVLRRGIVFIDLAIAQMAAVGVMSGALLFGSDSATLNGLIFALGGAGLIGALTRFWPEQREALIGLLYVGAAAVSILAISADPHGAQRLKALLAGDVLWVTAGMLGPLALATVPFIALTWIRPNWLAHDRVFYPVFAVLVSLSLPILGVYLVFATLIAPALACAPRARQRPSGPVGEPAPWQGWLTGVGGFGTGLVLAAQLDLPAGPTVVLALVALALGLRLWQSVVD